MTTATPQQPEQRDASFVVQWTDYTGKRQQSARTDRDHAYKLAATLPKSVVVHVGVKGPK